MKHLVLMCESSHRYPHALIIHIARTTAATGIAPGYAKENV